MPEDCAWGALTHLGLAGGEHGLTWAHLVLWGVLSSAEQCVCAVLGEQGVMVPVLLKGCSRILPVLSPWEGPLAGGCFSLS